ncbi:hypothetical protein FGE12_04665 [Aggregicoccus sp. 17bor-14]|uniref:hypothetical protein n=1 Tax=Myxococcaceae TaxID=31 RepID=UPI00129C972C|nr:MULTISPECIES: hypothetical protein [Myxococcaceae]MBF5041672.1 hypothetical protein [Simulacricoccus sp. 17bor-14]MRI87454.1 hypothetical protein [Aggregicoccus sp. 17bor-14]
MIPLAWSLAAVLAAAGVTPALQPPGSFHDKEPRARDGETWLALRVGEKEAALLPARLSVRAVHDEMLDAEGEKSGREVSSPVGDALMFLRVPGLSEGAVPRAKVASSESRMPHDDLQLGERAYRIRTTCVPAGVREGQAQLDCEIRLEQGGRSQRLVRMGGYVPQEGGMQLGDDANPRILFAGDLDRDGRLDLLFETSDHYNVSRPVLLLSSKAGADELVHEVARFESVGC